MRNYLICIFCILLFSACSDEVSKSFEPLPRALGKSNEIIVVCDQNMWDGPVGDSIDYYFESAYPIMPSPEPIFDLRHFDAEELESEPLKKQLRTYMIVSNLSDTDSPVTQMVRKDMGEERYQRALSDPEYRSSVGRDKWARGQLVIYLFATSDAELIETVKASFPAVSNRVNAHDGDQIRAAAYVKGLNKALSKKMEEEYFAKMQVPADYVLAKEDPTRKYVWLRKDTRDATLNITVERVKYDDQELLTKTGAKAMIDAFGKEHVSSPEPNSYLRINDEDLPMFEFERRINESYTKEVRGIWEMENDYMGGPFASYAILDSVRNEILFINTFIFAPGKDKRDLMQQMESVVETVELTTVGS